MKCYYYVIIFRYFQYLSTHGDYMKYNIKLAGIEANHCQDLVNQDDYRVVRARWKDMYNPS